MAIETIKENGTISHALDYPLNIDFNSNDIISQYLAMHAVTHILCFSVP
jgi:hypothetical protein